MSPALLRAWINAKAAEASAIECRRVLEDEMVTCFGARLCHDEGTNNFREDGFKIKIEQRFNRTINTEKLQDLAAEHGLTEHLGSLFRWKPELNKKVWAATDEKITAPLLGAITTKPGRPSFTIEKEES